MNKMEAANLAANAITVLMLNGVISCECKHDSFNKAFYVKLMSAQIQQAIQLNVGTGIELYVVAESSPAAFVAGSYVFKYEDEIENVPVPVTMATDENPF